MIQQQCTCESFGSDTFNSSKLVSVGERMRGGGTYRLGSRESCHIVQFDNISSFKVDHIFMCLDLHHYHNKFTKLRCIKLIMAFGGCSYGRHTSLYSLEAVIGWRKLVYLTDSHQSTL